MFHWYLTMFCADQLTSASSTVGLGADHLEKLMKLVQTTKSESRLACSDYVCPTAFADLGSNQYTAVVLGECSSNQVLELH